MLSTLSKDCIPANADISGVGIRASTYIQNFIGVFLAAYYLMDARITPEESEYIETTASAILMTGCAIIISSFIQAKTSGLSAYHAMIVLNLGWMNTSYLTVFAIFSYFGDGISTFLSRHEPKRKMSSLPKYLGLIHLSLMGGLGIWLWKDIQTFGVLPECNPYMVTVIFGHNVPAMNKSLRRWSLIVYGVAVIPLVNTVAIGFITAIVSGTIAGLIIQFTWGRFSLFNYLIRYLSRRHYTYSKTKNDDAAIQKKREFLTLGVCYVCCVVFLDVLFAVDTELMIHRNSSLVKSGESQWTFGQTLAVIVTVIPLLEARKCIEWWWNSKNTSSSPSHIKNISLDFQGDTPLTVNPPMGMSTSISESSTNALVPDSEAYRLAANDAVVATNCNPTKNKVEIEGAEPFTLAVALK